MPLDNIPGPLAHLRPCCLNPLPLYYLVKQLLDFNIDRFHDEVGRKCLKLDIQHSENDVFNSDDAYKLAEQYDVLVLEYHNEITSDVSTLLENIGWNITSITAHKDVQLCIPTTMIWAMSG